MVASVVLDTNIVLDLFVFSDPATDTLRQDLQQARLRWIATQPMRDELQRVLGYAHLAARLAAGQGQAAQVLAAFDAWVQLQQVPPKVALTCKDPDDQKFIDLAVAHQSVLLSKDNAVLSLARRLRAHGVQTSTAWAMVRPVAL